MRRVGIIGAGAVARALALRLGAGADVLLWARDADAARRAAGPARLAASLADLRAAETVLLAVSDRSIAAVAARLAEAVPAPSPGSAALHLSGYHGLDVLAPLATAGWEVGSAHPLASFPHAGGGEQRFDGARFALAGAGAAREAALELLRRLGGRELALAGGPESRAVYHAAAALSAGGLVALVDLALEALAGHVDRDEARRALAHLLGGVLAELERADTPSALSGPTARGDAEVVAGHLAVLPPEPAAAYRALVGRMLALARRRGLDPGLARAFAAKLSGPWPPSSP